MEQRLAKNELLTLEFFHHHEAEVLVTNVQNKTWSALVDAFGNICFHEEIEDLVTIASVMLVNQIEWIPFKVEVFVDSLALSERVEGLIEQHVQIKLEGLIESLLFHILSIN